MEKKCFLFRIATEQRHSGFCTYKRARHSYTDEEIINIKYQSARARTATKTNIGDFYEEKPWGGVALGCKVSQFYSFRRFCGLPKSRK
jgi:predicted alpha-1,6-mannanase (GH76 family)